jgi:pentose-5-phosphate-3-epimerase
MPAGWATLLSGNRMVGQRSQNYTQIDGGVGPANIADIVRAGADTFVAGWAVFNADSYADAIGAMRRALADVHAVP